MKEATLRNDPNIKFPAAVRAAAARSDEIVRQMTAAEQPSEVISEGNPELAAETLLSNTEQPSSPVEQSRQGQPAPSVDEDTWEHKYKSMKGRHDRLQDQVQELTQQISSLQGVMATLQLDAASAPLPELSAERLLTDEEVNDYGSDLLNVVGKKAREELTPIIKGYEAKISDLEKKLQTVNGVFAQDNHQKLLSNLDRDLPTWRELNTNDEFLSWLRLPDAYSGVIRHDMLKAAYAQGNASRVLAFFNGFLAEEAATDPAQAAPEIGTSTVPKLPLKNLAAPGRAKTAASTNAPAEKPIFTRAQIAQFYADVAANKYRGRDDQKNKLEADIFLAQREGRIR